MGTRGQHFRITLGDTGWVEGTSGDTGLGHGVGFGPSGDTGLHGGLENMMRRP